MEKKKHKKRLLSIVKLIVQIAFFILLPALYISALSGIQQIYLSIINGSFAVSTIWFQVIEAIAIIPVTILFGRFFCGWMCAFGTLGDVIYLASRKVFKTKIRISERADAVLKSIKYFVLAFIVIAVWTLGVKTFSTYSPWDVFGIIATVGKTPDVGYVVSSLLPGTIIFLLIVAASFFVERFFCRYLCPLGAVFAIISVLRIGKIRKPREGCGKCRVCTQNCVMGIPLYKHDVIRSGECINCFKCIETCPRGNAGYAVAGEDLRPVVAGLVAVSVMTGMYYAGSIASSATAISDAAVMQTSQSATANTASTPQTAANSSAASTPQNTVGSTAPAAQNSATGTSSPAKSTGSSSSSSPSKSTGSSSSSSQTGSSSTPKPTPTPTPKPTPTPTPAPPANSVYNDGTYQGSGTGFRGGTTTVSVVIKSDKITGIQISSYQDDAQFFNRAYNAVISEILSSQSTNVNAVSGATYSSNGIMSAVADALGRARI